MTQKRLVEGKCRDRFLRASDRKVCASRARSRKRRSEDVGWIGTLCCFVLTHRSLLVSCPECSAPARKTGLREGRSLSLRKRVASDSTTVPLLAGGASYFKNFLRFEDSRIWSQKNRQPSTSKPSTFHFITQQQRQRCSTALSKRSRSPAAAPAPLFPQQLPLLFLQQLPCSLSDSRSALDWQGRCCA